MKFLSMCKTVALTVLLYLVALPVMSQSLSTTFASNNADAGNTFDLTPTVNMNIDSFDVHLGVLGGETGAGSGRDAVIAIYWRPGTSSGFETNSSGWTLLGTANVVAQGTNIPTNVPIGGLSLTAGQTYGIYVDVQDFNQDELELLYTNGGPATFSNADLSLTTQYGLAPPAFTSFYGYRQWNGTVRYTKTQTCASEGYTGTKLEWCKNICERGYTGSTLNMWIRRWIDRYRNLPYCAVAPQPVPTLR